MDDKCIMENLLLTTKGVCDLYMHGTIEASTANVHQTFNQALNDSLCMQDDIYKEMSAKGWYQMEQAEQQKIMKVKNQFAGMYGERIERCYVKEELVQLVREELENRTNSEVVFFRTGHYHSYGVPLFQVGAHYFSSYE